MECTINSVRVLLIEIDIVFDFNGEIIQVEFPVSTPTREQAIKEIAENARVQRRVMLQDQGVILDEEGELGLSEECCQACEGLDLSRIGL